MIDFDHNATTPVHPQVTDAMVQMMRRDDLGNPSSVHGRGRLAREIVEDARRAVAAAVGAESLEVTLTSGGTEADSLALLGTIRARRRAGEPHALLTSALEHPAVTTVAQHLQQDGVAVHRVGVDALGRIRAEDVATAVRNDPQIGVVSLMAANHELGNCYDIPALVAAARSARQDVMFHTDAVQAVGKVPVDFSGWGVDLLSVSAHKFGGPPGVGALVHKRYTKLEPLCYGHQERGRRGGSEATFALAGFGLAASLAAAAVLDTYRHCSALRKRLIDGVQRQGADVAGDPDHHIGNTVNLGFEGCDGELMCMNLDLEGFAVSTGSACSAGSLEASPVLLAVSPYEQRARQAVRVSLGPDNTEAEVDAFLDALPAIIERVRGASTGPRRSA